MRTSLRAYVVALREVCDDGLGEELRVPQEVERLIRRERVRRVRRKSGHPERVVERGERTRGE